MKKLLFIVPVVAMVMAAGVFLPTPVGATANTAVCTVKAVGKKNTAGNADSRFALNGNGTVSATFEVTGNADCKQEVTLASWQAPDGDKGRPYELQKLYKFVNGTFGAGKHTLTVALPDCYYQVDLVRGLKPTGLNGGPVYEEGRMMGSLHGGTKVCEEPEKPEEPETPVTPETPTTPKVESTATTLPNTGAGNIVGLFAGTSAFGAVAHHVVTKRRNRRS